jgi:hypothetical protein
MKVYAVAALAIMAALDAHAQPIPQPVPEVQFYKQLLDEANTRVVNALTALSAAQTENAKLKEELKTKEAPKEPVKK